MLFKQKLYIIIFEADTKAGKIFDVILLIAILASVLLVMLESVSSIDEKYHDLLNISEWVITILFTIEYILRLVSIKQPLKYIFSFYGIIDLLSTIPKYLSFILVGSHNLAALRALRLLRTFRILKLARYIGASNRLLVALRASRTKIAVFLFFLVIICIILGTVMYMIEGEENGFTSIPRSVYWAIVTLTTVGYGDIAPQTVLGQSLASLLMIMGYAIIAVPTGILTAELALEINREKTQTNCKNCERSGHDADARFCKYCGARI